MVKKGDSGISEKSKKINKMLSPKQRDELLIQNFVGLQKAMTNLSVKFETLSDNITKLLHVFELSAKSIISGNTGSSGNESDKDLLKKIDSLLDQNKTIAKGLVLMEEKLRSRSEPQQMRQPIQGFARPRQLPKL